MKPISKIVITGSSGMIGSRLFSHLLEKGYKVSGFDRKENKWNPKLNEFTIIGDLLLEKDLKKIPKDIDLIIHLAANPRVYDLVIKPDLALENINTVYNVVNFAKKNKIKNVLFSSSREVYGNKKEFISSEACVDINNSESPYAASKIAGESLTIAFSKCYQINYIICRFSNVYGMYDESQRFFPLLIGQMKNNKKVKIFGKDKVLDFTYIDDCISGIVKCVENFEKAKNNTFNIASGKGENIFEVSQILKKSLNSTSKITIESSLTGEVKKFIADITKAKTLLGYSPKYSLQEGVDLCIDWYAKNIK
jgi:nucleoside-diphosphate-sugar epimerase